MHVVATAGHVDHGKSTLVHALTGMQPDRWAEEQRRGLTIDLGFAWTELAPGRTVAFVDVPGHERFVPNMLAGVGPVPAALFVVAADEGWMPQSAEHLAALHALGVRHGLLAVTRSDLADPAPATEQALAELRPSSLGTVEAVAVSAPAGDGLPELRAALGRMLAALPEPDLGAPVRLWIDRAFTVRGSGTVVTGTLAAGCLRAGDEVEIAPGGRTARVRGLQALGRPLAEAPATARVAVNLRGVDAGELRRGDALLTPRRFRLTGVVDARLDGDDVASLPRGGMLHIGSAAVPVTVRPLGPDTARLTLARQLPLRIGDRGLLRDPGTHHVSGGLTVLDVAPPAFRRRGAAAVRAEVLAGLDGRPDERAELRRRGIVRAPDLERMGVTVTLRPAAGDWLVDERLRADLRQALPRMVTGWTRRHPLEAGPPLDVVRRALRLPDLALVHALLTPGLAVRAGRVVPADGPAALPAPVQQAVDRVRADLRTAPFAAPQLTRLAELGLGRRELAAAVRTGALVQLAEGVVLLPSALPAAARALGALPQPFTVSQARAALGTTRRVAVPLLELLDRRGVTRRLPDDTRRMAEGPT
ncbi:Selenocysteine-specific elongation factor [Streptomyces sp. RB5]|uniref:Selenocysteine-specific elongation factor n=1 Tax=Streptomyces smaragdinus TaxID=2585196 RepID=A0A7K0C9M4_9ACTN|nr:selenocysteine-specific translation elongation factor [Streptomyces smaragdinus]MQY10149.1 Selenocysteine-specific elongation factor [Streptomyces smaragdinus]